MKIKILDPTIDGTLTIENPKGEECGYIYQYTHIKHTDIKNVPELEVHFKSYLTVLGKTHMGYDTE